MALARCLINLLLKNCFVLSEALFLHRKKYKSANMLSELFVGVGGLPKEGGFVIGLHAGVAHGADKVDRLQTGQSDGVSAGQLELTQRTCFVCGRVRIVQSATLLFLQMLPKQHRQFST